MDTDLSHARILIVDDELANTVLLGKILRSAGYDQVVSCNEPEEAVQRFQEARAAGEAFDLLCTDLHMPRMDGLQVIDQVMAMVDDDSFFPILVLTADVSPEAEQDALARGAKDFLTKPFRKDQIRLRVANLLRTRFLQQRLKLHVERLEELVHERTIELEAARLDVLDRLAAAAEYRDYNTGRHTLRVGMLSGLLAKELGLPHDETDLIRRAAPLHDVGKIGIPDHILLKPGRLTPDEFVVMKQHAEIGWRILSGSDSELLELAASIARTHHEKWDGSGYPRGLAGEEIPIEGRIAAVADVFDAVTSARPYKKAWPLADAVALLEKGKGQHFDPELVEIFLGSMDEVLEIRERFSDGLEKAPDSETVLG